MVGMALPIARTSNAGVALATTWMAKPRDTEGYKHGSYTIGPRIFVAY